MSLRTPSLATFAATGITELRFADATGRLCCQTRDKNPTHLCPACASEFARLRDSTLGPDPAPTFEALLGVAPAPSKASASASAGTGPDPAPTFEALLAKQGLHR